MVKYYVFKANLCFDLCNSLASLNIIDNLVCNLYLLIMCYFIFITSFQFHVNICSNNDIIKDNRDTRAFAPTTPKKKVLSVKKMSETKKKGILLYKLVKTDYLLRIFPSPKCHTPFCHPFQILMPVLQLDSMGI